MDSRYFLALFEVIANSSILSYTVSVIGVFIPSIDGFALDFATTTEICTYGFHARHCAFLLIWVFHVFHWQTSGTLVFFFHNERIDYLGHLAKITLGSYKPSVSLTPDKYEVRREHETSLFWVQNNVDRNPISLRCYI